MRDGSPIGQWHGPFLTYIAVCKINKFLKGCIRWEHALVFCYLADLTVIPLNGICGIDKLTDDRSILEVFGQLIPVVLPGSDNDRILFTPFFIQLEELIFCGFLIDCLIDTFQIP